MCKKAELGANLMEKIHLFFSSKLLLPSATLTNGWNFQLQITPLIYESFLLVFSYFLDILEVFFLHLLRFASNNAMGERDVQNKAQERRDYFMRSVGFQRTASLKIHGKILSSTWSQYECKKWDHLTLITCDFASSMRKSGHQTVP